MPPLTPDDAVIDQTEPFTSGARLGWWGGYVFLVLTAFCFGVWTGTQRPRPVEAAAAPVTPPTEKANLKVEPTPETKQELTPEQNKTPEPKVPEPKKAPEVVTPETKKMPEVVTPEPMKTPEPKVPPMVKEVLFAKDVLPIFKAKCMLCHGDTKSPKADLDLRTLASVVKGGDNGPGVKGGDLKAGTVWASIENVEMPPPDKTQLTDAEKAIIRNWILSGAK